ncbi:MAG: DUF3105 domain-containing protein [candidate division NC10 bacterium]|nr:DUF3105 domain-containing protein [candidate division NC10 bacterium]
MSKAGKRQRKEEAKVRRAEERRREARRRQIMRLAAWAVLLLSLGYAGYWAYGRITARVTWQEFSSLGNAHIPNPSTPHIPYNSDPPTSGPHTPYLAKWGIHDRPVPKEEQVHNLEDGGVIIQYNCPEGCPDLVDKLKAIAQRYDRLILAPYPGMDKQIALTAWRRLDKFNEFGEQRIIRFIDAHIGIDHHPR